MSRGLGLILTLLNAVGWVYFHRQVLTLLPQRARLLRIASPLVFLVLFHPALVLVVGGRTGLLALRHNSAMWLSMTVMAAQFALWVCLLGLIGVGLVAALSRLRARFKRRAVLEPQVQADRRRLVAGAALMLPAGAVSLSVAGVWGSRQTPVVTKIQIPVRREFSHLHGLTLAQVSDVHIGSYMDAPRLDEIARVMNALGADHHVITGDLLDNHIDQMELATRFIKGLAPKRGEVFACMGNHEYIAARTADVRSIVTGLQDAGAQMLVDHALKIKVGADHLWMAGIDYPPKPKRTDLRSTAQSLKHVLSLMQDDGSPRILLSHHPRTFHEVRELPFDLTLSGHTHGGQIKLGRIGDYALTPMLVADFYHNGLYEHQGRRLYVNSGAGGWLPVRINCPPEITLVTLVAG